MTIFDAGADFANDRFAPSRPNVQANFAYAQKQTLKL